MQDKVVDFDISASQSLGKFSGYLRGIYFVPRLHSVNMYREHRVAQGMVEAACAPDTPVVAD